MKNNITQVLMALVFAATVGLVFFLCYRLATPETRPMTKTQSAVVKAMGLKELALFEDCYIIETKTWSECFLQANEPPRVRKKRNGKR